MRRLRLFQAGRDRRQGGGFRGIDLGRAASEIGVVGQGGDGDLHEIRVAHVFGAVGEHALFDLGHQVDVVGRVQRHALEEGRGVGRPLEEVGVEDPQVEERARVVRAAREDLLEELARLEKDGPTEEERQLAVTKAESEHAFAYETSDGVAAAYGITQLTGNLDDELRYVDRLRSVTREQIRDAARKYLPMTDYACIAFVPGGK